MVRGRSLPGGRHRRAERRAAGSWCTSGAWKHHVSLCPVPDALDAALARDLAPYLSGGGTVRFPLREPIPYDLVEWLVGLLVVQNAGGAPRA